MWLRQSLYFLSIINGEIKAPAIHDIFWNGNGGGDDVKNDYVSCWYHEPRQRLEKRNTDHEGKSGSNLLQRKALLIIIYKQRCRRTIHLRNSFAKGR